MDRKTPRKFATTPGTRDVLPPESTRLLDVQGRIRARFELFGFREVLTPALEYAEVIEEHGLRDVSYKLFDQDNQMLLLRPEMTTPIARVISQRLAGSPPPHKLSYVLPAYRRASVGRGQSAELYQAGVEVVGSASPREDASTIALLVDVLQSLGLSAPSDFAVVLGQSAFYAGYLRHVAPDAAKAVTGALAAKDLVAVDDLAGELPADAAAGGRGIPRIVGPAADESLLEECGGGLDLLPSRRRRKGRHRRPGRRVRFHECRVRGEDGTPVSGLRVAVPKGAIFADALAALEMAGLPAGVLRENGRRLIYRAEGNEFIVSRPSDVPVFVEYGAADIGIVGKDVLDEQRPNVVELKDLGTGRCRMILAAPEGRAEDVRRAIRHAEVIRVATKFPDTARRYFERMGRQAEVIELHGSIELAPLVGLAECIIDLTATGTTLRENDLVVLDEISTSTARLISNRGAYRLRHSEVVALSDAIQGNGESRG